MKKEDGNQGAAGYSGAIRIGVKRYIESQWSHWIDMVLVPEPVDLEREK